MERVSYDDGIKRARAEGYIIGEAQRCDGFSHRAELTRTNSRKLDGAAVKVLRAWPGSRPRFLELGPGFGVGVSAASILAPNATIHTAGGLTEVNPYWRISHQIALGEGRDAIADMRKRFPRKSLELDDLMPLQAKSGWTIFDTLEDPYIQSQQVGRFADFQAPDEPYDIIYESCGPNWHERDPAVFGSTMNVLSEGGVICMNSDPVGEVDASKVPFIVPMGYHRLMIAGDSFLAEAIKTHIGRQVKPAVTRDLIDALLDGLIEKKRRGRW